MDWPHFGPSEPSPEERSNASASLIGTSCLITWNGSSGHRYVCEEIEQAMDHPINGRVDATIESHDGVATRYPSWSSAGSSTTKCSRLTSVSGRSGYEEGPFGTFVPPGPSSSGGGI